MHRRLWSAVQAPVVLTPVAALGLLVLVVCVAAPVAAGAQDESDNDLDRFMERVLAQRERNVAARRQYVLDEESHIRLKGPGGIVLWGFRGEYTWYEHDGFFVRSPTRIDGVAIDDAKRREYEAEWLEREQIRQEEQSTQDNVRLTIERIWGAAVDEGIPLDAIVDDAQAWGDHHAAITTSADRILPALGGVSSIGLDRAMERAGDGFEMLEKGRLYPDEVEAMLNGMIPALVPALVSATDEEFARYLELLDQALRFNLRVAPAEVVFTGTPADPAAGEARAAALVERWDAFEAIPEAPTAERDRARLTPSESAADDARARSLGRGQPIEPLFLSDSYFLEFKFEPGNYYLAGRETLDGQDVLRIEYYPERLVPRSDDGEPDRDTDRAREGNSRAQGSESISVSIGPPVDQTTLVTLWVDPVQHQIVRYVFDDYVDFGSMPGRWLVRLLVRPDRLSASMTMRQPFEGVWLPARIDMRGVGSLATGAFEVIGTRTFTNYREAVTDGRIRAISPELPR